MFDNVTCDKCNYVFGIRSDSIREGVVVNSNQSLSLVYFTCPKCNKIYKVCLKDAKSTELALDIEKAKNRIRRNKGRNNIELQQKLFDMVMVKQKRLKDYANKLNGKFTGTFTFATSENNSKDETIIYLP